jgi:ketosteroid isomerase-like protein
MSATDTTAEQEEFVRYFAEGWAMGAGEPFFQHFLQRKHPDVLLEQPLSRPARGEAGMRALFEPLFAAMPDLRGEVVRWGPTGDGVLIELTLRGTLGGRPLEWTVVDRIVLEDGLIRSRRSYFDPLPLLPALLSRPRTALRLLPGAIRRENR